MQRPTTFVLAGLLLGSLALPGRASAQAAPPAQCPPGQPCVVVVPDPNLPPQPQPQPTQVIIQAQPADSSAYVTTQPMAGPAYAPTQGREVRHSRLRWGMVVPGIVLVAVGWFSNWITGVPGVIQMELDDSHPGEEGRYFGWQWIPWIGPFVGAGYWAGSRHDGYFAAHLVWGVMQLSGLVLCILGTVLPEEEVVMEYALGEGRDAPRLAFSPYAGESAGGLSATLTF